MRFALSCLLVAVLGLSLTGCRSDASTDETSAPPSAAAAASARSDVERPEKSVAREAETAPEPEQPVPAREPAPAPEPAPEPEQPPAAPVQPARTSACPGGDVRPLGNERRALAAVVRRAAVAYREPGGARIERFGSRNMNGVPTVFGVLAERLDGSCRASWYRVQLPLRPNGITGWVRAADVAVVPVTTRIVVDLSERLVTLYDGGRVVHTARAAIGTTATPTPTGRYYVNQRLVPRDPTGPFGPGAIGISAFSPVLTGWAQGGPIAIHGTNRPDLIGQAASNGCVRVRNDDLRVLFAKAHAGTPVLIRS